MSTPDELLTRLAKLPAHGPAGRICAATLTAGLAWLQAFQAYPEATKGEVADLALDRLVEAAEMACEALGA